jgi:hypothetical protein
MRRGKATITVSEVCDHEYGGGFSGCNSMLSKFSLSLGMGASSSGDAHISPGLRPRSR